MAYTTFYPHASPVCATSWKPQLLVWLLYYFHTSDFILPLSPTETSLARTLRGKKAYIRMIT